MWYQVHWSCSMVTDGLSISQFGFSFNDNASNIRCLKLDLSWSWSLVAWATMMPYHLPCLALVLLPISDFHILKLISVVCSISSPGEVCMAIILRFSSLAPFIPSCLLILVVVIAYPTHFFPKQKHATHVQITHPSMRDGLLPYLCRRISGVFGVSTVRCSLWYFKFSVPTYWCLYVFVYFNHVHPKCLIKLQSPWRWEQCLSFLLELDSSISKHLIVPCIGSSSDLFCLAAF